MSNLRSLKPRRRRVYEVALDRDGKVLHGSPWRDKAVKKEDVRDYFFYPRVQLTFIDIVVLATSCADAREIARIEVKKILAAGKWGIDHLGEQED